jgi:iduronate 2-sulfatase
MVYLHSLHKFQAWSSYGEILAYSDIQKLNASGAPGTVLPRQIVLELRRAYYSAVSHTDDQLGAVLKSLRANGFAENTVISLWGDQ